MIEQVDRTAIGGRLCRHRSVKAASKQATQIQSPPTSTMVNLVRVFRRVLAKAFNRKCHFQLRRATSSSIPSRRRFHCLSAFHGLRFWRSPSLYLLRHLRRSSIICAVQVITGLEMGIHLIADRTGNVAATFSRLAPAAVSRVAAVTRTERVPESCESSFLLDWLAGGEACQRNIQGFSFRFEALNSVVAS